jgi:hypothetical protein
VESSLFAELAWDGSRIAVEDGGDCGFGKNIMNGRAGDAKWQLVMQKSDVAACSPACAKWPRVT